MRPQFLIPPAALTAAPGRDHDLPGAAPPCRAIPRTATPNPVPATVPLAYSFREHDVRSVPPWSSHTNTPSYGAATGVSAVQHNAPSGYLLAACGHIHVGWPGGRVRHAPALNSQRVFSSLAPGTQMVLKNESRVGSERYAITSAASTGVTRSSIRHIRRGIAVPSRLLRGSHAALCCGVSM